jgi:hypothetical protein
MANGLSPSPPSRSITVDSGAVRNLKPVRPRAPACRSPVPVPAASGGEKRKVGLHVDVNLGWLRPRSRHMTGCRRRFLIPRGVDLKCLFRLDYAGRQPLVESCGTIHGKARATAMEMGIRGSEPPPALWSGLTCRPSNGLRRHRAARGRRASAGQRTLRRGIRIRAVSVRCAPPKRKAPHREAPSFTRSLSSCRSQFSSRPDTPPGTLSHLERDRRFVWITFYRRRSCR